MKVTTRFGWKAVALTLGVTLIGAAGSSAQTRHHQSPVKPTIVLVHGAWADGSSWSAVTKKLQRKGFTVAAVPNPLRGLASDSAYLSAYLATITGPIVLVGHSYGGMVITDAATGNANVKSLVYVNAFIPRLGDTVNTLTQRKSRVATRGRPNHRVQLRPDPERWRQRGHLRQAGEVPGHFRGGRPGPARGSAGCRTAAAGCRRP